MHRLSPRVKKLKRKDGPKQPLLVHMFPDQTEEEAFAEHIRENGPIPSDADVMVIVHTFRSSI